MAQFWMGFQALKSANSWLSLRGLKRRKPAKNQPRKCKLLDLIDYNGLGDA